MAVTDPSVREVIGSPVEQGVDESIRYTIDVSRVGVAPTNPSCLIKDLSDSSTDVTGDVATGTPSVVGSIIYTPYIADLVDKHVYRVEVLYELGNNLIENYFVIHAKE